MNFHTDYFGYVFRAKNWTYWINVSYEVKNLLISGLDPREFRSFWNQKVTDESGNERNNLREVRSWMKKNVFWNFGFQISAWNKTFLRLDWPKWQGRPSSCDHFQPDMRNRSGFKGKSREFILKRPLWKKS